MENTIKFSVIMPCYNSAAYVKNALDSIKNQTYPNWELIAVNDGSKDETPEILHAYAKEDSRIKVFEKENGGYATAINCGLEHISGDYFLMLGSDDRLETSLFENLCKELEKINFLPDCFAFRAIKVYNAGDTIVDPYTDFTATIQASQTSLKAFSTDYPAESSIFFARDTAKCFKRSLLEDLRYFGWSGYDADGIFSMLMCHKAKSFACFPVDGYFWTLRPDSVSASVSLAKNVDRIENWWKFYKALNSLPTSDICPTEVDYLSCPLSILIYLAQDPTIAKQEKVFLKKNAKHLKKVASRYKKSPVGFSASIIAFSPVMYSKIIKLVSKIKK